MRLGLSSLPMFILYVYLNDLFCDAAGKILEKEDPHHELEREEGSFPPNLYATQVHT